MVRYYKRTYINILSEHYLGDKEYYMQYFRRNTATFEVKSTTLIS